jgi:hypothetical protein
MELSFSTKCYLFYKSYDLKVKKVNNATVHYEETAECRYKIFWPGRQRVIYCHTGKQEPNTRTALDRIYLLVTTAKIESRTF